MIVVSVTYPAAEGSRFDLDYYRTKHMPLVRSRWGACGLMGAKFVQGVGAPGGGSVAFHMTALLSFASQDDFQRAAQQHGKEIMSDIRNFTDVKPVVQFNEEMG